MTLAFCGEDAHKIRAFRLNGLVYQKRLKAALCAQPVWELKDNIPSMSVTVWRASMSGCLASAAGTCTRVCAAITISWRTGSTLQRATPAFVWRREFAAASTGWGNWRSATVASRRSTPPTATTSQVFLLALFWLPRAQPLGVEGVRTPQKNWTDHPNFLCSCRLQCTKLGIPSVFCSVQ